MMTDVYTQTLTSGTVLTVPATMSFGDMLIAGPLLALVVLCSLYFLYEIVGRR